ncbi:hypothetical protein KUTeg_014216 [Tegillarca granosa]|uniref:EF-hand domain-containing protein n=1 Tax=Tegillarca granosa TaxID=220873 RepID=A0ABQ9F0D3_TEGGR|nr:hypothetical protein KUTeg_014216 [Tegillarca granosa]
MAKVLQARNIDTTNSSVLYYSTLGLLQNEDEFTDEQIEGNGTIEFNEFIDMMKKQGQHADTNTDEAMREAFRVFDKDGNGYIDFAELKENSKK